MKDLTEPAVPAETPSRVRRRRRRGVPAPRGSRREPFLVPAREQRVDALAYFALNQAAVLGGSLKLNGDALVARAQVAHFMHSIQINWCASLHISDIGHGIIGPGEYWILCKPAQFRQSLGKRGFRASQRIIVRPQVARGILRVMAS
jgi:hypothetical protein